MDCMLCHTWLFIRDRFSYNSSSGLSKLVAAAFPVSTMTWTTWRPHGLEDGNNGGSQQW